MQTKSYSDLLALIQALIGAGSLTDPEKAQILQFVNRRAHEAYQTSDSWPRYMIANEPRTVVANQTVPYSEDSVYIYGASKSDANGLYLTSDSGLSYTLSVSSSVSYTIFPGDSGTANIVDQDDNIIYQATASTGVIPQSGWLFYQAPPLTSTPTEIVATSVANIAEFIRIHRTQPFLNRSALEYDFYTTAQGAHIMNISGGEANVAYITYKKEFSPFAADSANIPQEWFYFIAHGSYADFLRVQDKQEEAIAEEQVAGTYLALELEKIDNRVNNTNLVNRFSTYVNRQSR
tara:strand:+ start:149 stop:1021 length:873 start_codon:yes stop_codon:yes gene_type:complete